MKKAIVLSGISGSGKTTLRNSDEYKDIPYVDMADIYNKGFVWPNALAVLLNTAIHKLNSSPTVIIEGYFLPNSKSRNILKYELGIRGIEVEFIFFDVPVKECLRRLEVAMRDGKIGIKEFNKRKSVLLGSKGYS